MGATITSPIEEWDETIEVNLKAAMRLSKFSMPHLLVSAKAGKAPCVINVASVAGRNYFGGLTPCTFRLLMKLISSAPSALTKYASKKKDCASKHGLLGFAGSLFTALQSKGIRVTSIIPGYAFYQRS